MEQIRLNIVPQGVPPVCHVSQYDAGRVVRLILMDGLQGYVISDETFVLNVRKPDDTVVTVAVAGVSGDSFVDFVTTEQMAAVAGENICELKITKDDTVIGSLNFRMKVERDPMDGGSGSHSEIHDLRAQVAADVALEVADQYDADAVIFDSQPTAGHGIGYAVTSEGLKTVIDVKANSADLATVATSGSYNDLSNKPVIDSSLSSSSTNAVQNKAVKTAIDLKADSNVVNSDFWSMTGGTIVPYDADLNTYLTVGNYTVQSNTIAQRVSNLPVQTAGSLKVFRLVGTTANYIVQIYIAYDTATVYRRVTVNLGSSWKPWYMMPSTNELASVATSGSYGDLLNKPMTEQGTVNNINFSGLAQGMYRCYVPTNSTGTPASNIGGHCLTFINDSVNYGSQILFSNLGLFWRNRAGGTWGAWHTLEEPDLHTLTAGTSITIEKGGYVKQGRIVTVCVTIKANANRSVGDIVLTGLPAPLNNNDALTGAQMAGSTGTFAFRINSVNLYPNQALTSGQSYVINGSYLANSY